MQKMNSSAAVILLHDRPVWHEEGLGGWVGFCGGGGGGESTLTPSSNPLAMKFIAKLCLNLTGRRPLVFLTGELLPV